MEQVTRAIEKHYRVDEAAQLTGLAVISIRRKIAHRQIGFRKAGRAVLIPESEVMKLLGRFIPAQGQ
jgi:excisionase family DNA binding protein